MIPINPLEHQNAFKTLYSKCVGPVCRKHHITRMELDILLFLANHPGLDTATDIITLRYLSKSQVSSSVSLLCERGYLQKEYRGNNRKTVHLLICAPASGIVEDGHKAQERFFSIMVQGIPEGELAAMKRCIEHMQKNIDNFLKEDELSCTSL